MMQKIFKFALGSVDEVYYKRLYKITLVCKHWRAIVVQTPLLWANPDGRLTFSPIYVPGASR